MIRTSAEPIARWFRSVGSSSALAGVLCLLLPLTSGPCAAYQDQPQRQPDPAATVLGETIRTDDAAQLQAQILTRLFDDYAQKQGISVTDAELDAFVEQMRRGMRAEGLTANAQLSPEEAAEAAQMRREMGRALIRQWKLNRALYQHYGGRIIAQQLGPEPLDAYRRYLQERQADGDLVIHDHALQDAFWRYFTDDRMHFFYDPGSEAEAQAFEIPPGERAAQAQ